MLWSDFREGWRGLSQAPRAGKLYGRDVVEKALEAFKANVLIRAYEPIDGYREMFDEKPTGNGRRKN